VKQIIATVEPDVPILVHSMNVEAAPAMAATLVDHGFSVTRVRMTDLTGVLFARWLAEVTEAWADQ
jgi:hypothetical protein